MTEPRKNKTTAKRKTLTLPVDLNDKLKRLGDETFVKVMRTIFAVFFEGKIIHYEDYDEITQTALACIMPDLRRIQTQFDNGRCEKNRAKTIKGGVCPFEASQTQPNSANYEPSIYNNIYNINNNKNNKQTITNSRPADAVSVISNQIQTRLLALESNSEAEQQTVTRFGELVSRIAREPNPLAINSEALAPEQILMRFEQIFERKPAQTIDKLTHIFQMLDEACQERKITNTYRYSVALFYNQAMSHFYPSPSKNQQSVPEFSARNYTAEEMNSLFDNLDEIEV